MESMSDERENLRNRALKLFTVVSTEKELYTLTLVDFVETSVQYSFPSVWKAAAELPPSTSSFSALEKVFLVAWYWDVFELVMALSPMMHNTQGYISVYKIALAYPQLRQKTPNCGIVEDTKIQLEWWTGEDCLGTTIQCFEELVRENRIWSPPSASWSEKSLV